MSTGETFNNSQQDSHSSWDNFEAPEMLNIAEFFDEDQEIQENADNILPYLTLDKLSDENKSDILQLSHDVIKLDTHNEDKVLFYSLVENALADTIGDRNFRAHRTIDGKLMQARKLFCASLYEYAGSAVDEEKMWDIYDRFFSFSPGADAYCGGFKDSLELLGISEQIPFANNPFSRSIYGEVTYNTSFSETNEFESTLEQSNAEEKLQLLPIIFGITRYCSADDWNNRTLDKISRAFDQIEHDDKNTPLASVLAKDFGEKIDAKIDSELHSEWITLDPLNPEHAEMIEKDQRRRKNIVEHQQKLHEKYNILSKDRWIEEISPDAAVSMTQNGRIETIADAKGNKTSFLRYERDNTFGLSREDVSLLGTVYNSDVKGTMNRTLKVDIADIPLDSQVQLFRFMATADNQRFEKLCSTLGNIDENLRLKLTKNFVAADFGEDFGDSLLEIASSEQFSSEQVEKILDSVESCRESIRGITDFYHDFDDGNFAKEYARAANERLTDALTVFQEIAETGSAGADLDWLGRIDFNYDSAIEALEYEQKSLKIVNGTLTDVVAKKEGVFAETIISPKKDKMKRTMYSLYSPEHGYCLLYTRPEGAGSFDPAFEYGNRRGVEASVSLIVNPVDPFSLPNPYRPLSNLETPYTQAARNKVSAIRLDREGRALGQAADDPDRDPINPIGIVSVDLAAVGDAENTPSGKIARLFSVGNKIRSEKFNRSDFELNHNTAWFEQEKYGTSEGFKNLVDYVDFTVSDLCKQHPPLENEGFKGALRQEKSSSR